MLRGDAGRAALTALALYAAFWNPFLQFSNASTLLDAAVSYVDTGRWGLAHADLYDGKDSATARDGRLVPGVPFGTAVVIVPLYVAWRVIAGPVDTPAAFHAFNGIVALALGATAMALTVAQVHWLAGWLGASAAGQALAALLFAVGTQAFQLGTMVSKESLTVLALTSALRLAVAPGGACVRAAAGALASAAVLFTHGVAVAPALLGLLVLARDGARPAAAFAAGGAPLALALGAYNTAMFGRPWLTSYSAITGLETRFASPKAAIVADLLVGPRGGLVLYAPFLLVGLVALVRAWPTPRRGEALVTAALLASLLVVGASWQSQFGDRASWSHGLGPRYLFGAVPLLAAFAGSRLERLRRGSLLAVAVPSVVFGYLGVQAGFAPVANPLPYALKTFLSGSGMGVAFKEGLPRWLGFDNVHTLVSRPELTFHDALVRLGAEGGAALLAAQAACAAANLLVLAGVAWLAVRLWRPRPSVEVAACAS